MKMEKMPIILFAMILVLVSAFTIKKMDFEYFSIQQVLGSFDSWFKWKLMPGW